ncbi:RNA polymerase sigma factor [Chitinimonas naiadis]
MTQPLLPTDTELHARLKQGDEAAFTVLYRRHKDAVYRFALMLSGASGLAADATQETFLFLIRQPDRYDPARASLSAFLMGVARNHVRRGQQDVPLGSSGSDDEDEDAASSAHDITPLSLLLAGETLTQLQAAIQALPFAYRETLVLCDLQELPYLDVAVIVGCPVGTVRSRLNRARARLAEALALHAPAGLETTP